MADTSKRFVVLAKVTGVHGVKGQVKIKSFTDDPMAVGDYGPLQVGNTDRQLELLSLKPHKDNYLVWFRGIDSREKAEALKDAELKVRREALPEVSEDEVYYADLIGLEVHRNDKTVGKVVNVVNFGAGDLLDIAFDGIRETQFLPLNEASVPVIDVENGFVVIDPPDWMFEDKS